MEILTNYSDLVGKKIVFSHMAKFANQITLGTEDGCVLMATFDVDDLDFEQSGVKILYPHQVVKIIGKNEWMREELGKLGIFDIEEYNKQERLRREKERLEAEKRKEARERAEYERLKAKFEKQ